MPVMSRPYVIDQEGVVHSLEKHPRGGVEGLTSCRTRVVYDVQLEQWLDAAVRYDIPVLMHPTNKRPSCLGCIGSLA